MTQSARLSERRKAFTLTELLVVIAIIATLIALIFPAVRQGYIQAMRGACKANVRRMVEACQTYAVKDRLHLGPGSHVDMLPMVDVTAGNWPNITDGNPACLWLLIKHRLAARNLFLCPEAATRFGNTAPGDDDTAFRVDATTGGATLSYSYMSMAPRENDDDDDDIPDTATLSELLSLSIRQSSFLGQHIRTSLVLIADKNPRIVFDQPALDPIIETYSPNSNNHLAEGQNIGRMDGSADWVTETGGQDTDGDDIYAPLEVADEAFGSRTGIEDSFCAP